MWAGGAVPGAVLEPGELGWGTVQTLRAVLRSWDESDARTGPGGIAALMSSVAFYAVLFLAYAAFLTATSL